jgi:hypothetical protein
MAPRRSEEQRKASQEATNWVSSYQHAKAYDEDFKVSCLEKALAAQKEAARLESLFIHSLTPCRACGRKVTSPCHDTEGYYEGGPWDDECQYLIKGESGD